ncbi:hypothetical protein AN958_03335 [Leucoagaricus sp. SymC.cos]|nr:hypothetical protein AN958_03335 [Leucoagaricus sp. SymC.cos]
MPARSTVYPTADHATFRDLNIFEQRLKETAAALKHRKSRYQLFLAQLLVAIAILLVEVLLPPEVSILSIPYNALLRWLLPEIYTPDQVVLLHPFFSTGLLFVSVTTLALFFASGTYSEKISYANKYVPHTNRSLRSFNMYFNTRKPPLHSKFRWNPLSFFFPRPEHTHSTSPPPSRSPSPPTAGRNRSQSGSRPIPSIPPATNPRGELIFSSRVDKTFREGYVKYRTAFEKKREEAIRQINEQKRIERWWWLYKLRFWAPPPTPSSLIPPTFSRTVSNSSSRGRGGTPRSGTPPTPGSSSSSIASRQQRDRSGSPMRQPRSPGRRNPNRRVTPEGSESRNRREMMGEDGDMRMRALERSLVHGSPSP